MSAELGKATYELDANLEPLRRQIAEGRKSVDGFEDALDRLSEISRHTERAVNQIKMSYGQGAESNAVADAIISGVHGISDEAREAARELDRVKLTSAQAAESDVAGEAIKRNVKDVGDEADRTKRKLEEVRLAGGRNGVGVGPFGSGFGRVGLLGTAIGAGALTAPAAGPGAFGLAAMLPVLGGAAAGSLGVLALAFDGVTKSIGGNKKAFEGLTPSAQQFVLTVRSLDGWFTHLKETAAGGLFPGLERGLRDALSAGTVNAVTAAVTALSRALGLAGEAWGRYFGSTEFQQIFGPLIQSAARTIGSMSDAMLHLFDAVGVVARAAIPLTSWMTSAIDDGAKLADTWLHAKDSTGQLGGAMNEAKTSLQLVAGLISAVVSAVGALGTALYPVSKVAVKDLTDGFNALAHIIRDNEGEIRLIVGGALAAFVSMVKALMPVVKALARDLDDVAHAVGGWKHAFEIVTGGLLISRLATVAARLGGVSDEALKGLGTIAKLRLGLAALADINPIVIPITLAIGIDYLAHDRVDATNLGAKGGSPGQLLHTSSGYYLNRGGRSVGISATRARQILGNEGFYTQSGSSAAEQAASPRGSSVAALDEGRRTAKKPTEKPSTDIFGSVPPWTSGTGRGGSGSKAPTIPGVVSDLLNRASENASKAKQLGNVGGTAKRFLEGELVDLEAAHKKLLAKLRDSSGKSKIALEKKATEVANEMRDTHTLIAHAWLQTGCTLIPLPRKAETKAAPAPGELVAA